MPPLGPLVNLKFRWFVLMTAMDLTQFDAAATKADWRHHRAGVSYVHARCEVDRALSDEEVLCFKSDPNRNGITLFRLSLALGGFKDTVLFFHFQLHSLGSFEPCASAPQTTSISLANVSLRSRDFFGSAS
jgi:hypothetical protein